MHQVVASAIGSLSGPLHGGANEKVVAMLQKIDSKDDIRPWLDETLKAKNVVWEWDTENILSKTQERIF